MLKKVIPVEDAIAVVHDGDVLATTGYGGHGIPEQLLVTLEQRFLKTGTPRGLTLVHSTGQGDGADKGLNHLGHEGLLRRVIGGHYGLMPKVVQLVLANKVDIFGTLRTYTPPERGAITSLDVAPTGAKGITQEHNASCTSKRDPSHLKLGQADGDAVPAGMSQL